MKLSKEKFKPLFGTWWPKIEPSFELLDPIYAELKTLTSQRGKKVFPLWNNVFKAFEYCDFSKLKLVVCGISPYHTGKIQDKVLVPIADGLALSCSILGIEQPSLTKWYDALEKEYPNERVTRETDLKFLAEQGVLLFNMGLTVENMKALSHNELWKPFIKSIFENVIATSGVPVVLLGKESHLAEKWLSPFQWCFPISHPASAAYNNSDWNSEGVFKKVQRIIKENYNEDLKWF